MKLYYKGMLAVHLEGGRIAFYAGARFGATGPVVIRATAEGLQPGETQLASKPVHGAMVPLGDFDAEGIQGVKVKGRW